MRLDLIQVPNVRTMESESKTISPRSLARKKTSVIAPNFWDLWIELEATRSMQEVRIGRRRRSWIRQPIHQIEISIEVRLRVANRIVAIEASKLVLHFWSKTGLLVSPSLFPEFSNVLLPYFGRAGMPALVPRG